MPPNDLYLPPRSLVSNQGPAMVQKPEIPRSKFIARKTHKFTFDAGKLIPFFVDEILPGDHMQYSFTMLARMATPIFPLMDSQRLDVFWFFTPTRTVWTNWVRMMGEQPTGPADSTVFTCPVVTCPAGGYALHTIWDYLGVGALPGQITAGQAHDVIAFPSRIYREIYRWYFRDQNLISLSGTDVGNGPDTAANYPIHRRAKVHDYFTTCLPAPQKGVASIAFASGQAPVTGLGILDNVAIDATDRNVWETDNPTMQTYLNAQASSAASQVFVRSVTGASDTQPSVYATAQLLLGSTLGVTIEEIRRAAMLQAFLEKDQRGGTRYEEGIEMHFGVKNPDFRLQRPEYIGGGSSDVQVTPVAQTAPVAGLGVGTLGAAGTVVAAGSASVAATEHGYVLAICNVRSELTYQQGIHRLWTRSSRLDFYYPSFAGLSEQAVLRRELYVTGTDAEDTTIFGYQERWHEYRTMYNTSAGMFRSQTAASIDQWHLGEQFGAAPTLGATFIEDNPPMDRVLQLGAAEVNQQYLANVLINRTAVRALPQYGTPATFGRF